MNTRIVCVLSLLSVVSIISPSRGEPLRVCVTVPDLGSLTREVGGDEVRVVVFAKGTENPHFVEAKPGFVKELSTADLFVQMGMDLEIGWAPVLLRGSRNNKVQPGGAGFLDAAQVIEPIDVPTGPIDRTGGDVHALGNPHYMLDPVNGLKVARLIRDRLAALRPAKKEHFERRYEDFRRRLATALIGPKLAETYGYEVEKLMTLQDHGRLDEFLEKQKQADQLGGWLARLRPHRGVSVVDDHPLWAYFARRFGVKVVGHMEPKPGLAPTTRHLKELIGVVRQRGVKLVVSSPFFDTRHAAFLTEHTDARPVVLAHQVGALPEAADYLSMLEHNVAAVSEALESGAH